MLQKNKKLIIEIHVKVKFKPAGKQLMYSMFFKYK